MANEFDFKAQAQALLNRLAPKPGSPVNPGLALAAVEAALREAYARGRGDKTMAPPAPARAAKPSAAPASPAPVRECAHEWEDAFIDGRTLGARCVECGILQKDVQERCDHYFVQVGSGEVCVACRKPRRR